MNTLDHVVQKFNLDIMPVKMPLEIPMFDRKGLARLFAELGFRVGAEIGVATGEYSRVLCKANPDLKLYCIDPWERYEGYVGYVGVPDLNDFYLEAQRRLASYRCELVRKYSMDAVKDFEDDSLDFVYVDANHEFSHVMEDLTHWSKKVRQGGIVSGHDFRRVINDYPVHVVEAVRAYTWRHRIRPWFVLGRRDDPMNYKNGWVGRDRIRSYMWVKR